MLDPDPESSPADRISIIYTGYIYNLCTSYMMGDRKQFTSGVAPPPIKSLVLVNCKEKTCAGLPGSSCSDGETKCTLLMFPSFEMQIIGEQSSRLLAEIATDIFCHISLKFCAVIKKIGRHDIHQCSLIFSWGEIGCNTSNSNSQLLSRRYIFLTINRLKRGNGHQF